jgi:hypothetical protein
VLKKKTNNTTVINPFYSRSLPAEDTDYAG